MCSFPKPPPCVLACICGADAIICAAYKSKVGVIRDELCGSFSECPSFFYFPGTQIKLQDIKTEPSAMFFGSPFGPMSNDSKQGLVSVAITLRPAAAEVRILGNSASTVALPLFLVASQTLKQLMTPCCFLCNVFSTCLASSVSHDRWKSF